MLERIFQFLQSRTSKQGLKYKASKHERQTAKKFSDK